MKASLLLLILALGISAQIKKPEPPPVKVPFAESLQAVVVTTEDWTGTTGDAQLFERKNLKADWKAVGKSFDIVLGRNGLAWDRETFIREFANSTPTLMPVFKAYCSALVKKDDAGLRRVYARDTIEDFERMMKEHGITRLSEFLSDDLASNEFCETRNERIMGDSAVAEVRTNGYPNGIIVVFAKEAGEWRITNRRPEKAFVPSLLIKREGDGTSPAGMFPLTFAFGKAETITSKLSYRRLEDQTHCVDDVNSHHYNRVVGSLQVGIFDWKSSEKMAEITPEYDLGVFVAHNSYPVVKGNGSCIFLHIWKNANTPTSGCTAMAREDMERVVAWLDPKRNPYLVQIPEAEYKAYKKSWNLP
jgi:L,D-peptidoglycan transpeptidase YkuD (ErfK/YbiS/YcfS/YnhG family)